MIARCVRKLIDDNDNEIYERYETRSPEVEYSLKSELVCEIPDLFNFDNIVNINQIVQLERCVCDIGRLSNQYINDNNTNGIIALLIKIDESLQERLASIVSLEPDTVLNSNAEETEIEILPRFYCNWERGSKGKNNYKRIDNFLNNILIINKRLLSNYIVHNVYAATDLISDYDKLKLALCPMKKEPEMQLEFYVQNGQVFFSACNSGDYVVDNQTIMDHINSAGQNGADIIMFPEMLGNTDTVDCIKSFLRQKVFDNQRMPGMIVLPSVWHNHTNITTVLGRVGNEICCQPKRNGYKHKITKEDVEKSDTLDESYIGFQAIEGINKNKEIYVIHCRGIGRISIVICKDYLVTEDIQKLVQELKLTLLLVPSFSTGSHDFNLSDAAKINDCCIVWLNTCAAMTKKENFQTIGYVVKAGKHHNESDQLRHDLESRECLMKNQCDRLCIYYDSLKLSNY